MTYALANLASTQRAAFTCCVQRSLMNTLVHLPGGFPLNEEVKERPLMARR